MAEHEHPQILIVDDRPENLLALEEALKELHCDVVAASSGQEALRLVLKRHFDLALIDAQMPGMDGFELAQLMRGKKESKDVQFIFITAINKELKYIEKGYELGAINYLFKPIDPEELVHKVRVALQWSKYRQTVRSPSP